MACTGSQACCCTRRAMTSRFPAPSCGPSSTRRWPDRRIAGRAEGGHEMPPRGVKKGTKRARQYEKINRSQKQRGNPRAEEIAARTVQKERARSGEARQRSRTSTRDKSPSQRGGKRSGTRGPRGRTREQLYNEAKKNNIRGRSRMTN